MSRPMRLIRGYDVNWPIRDGDTEYEKFLVARVRGLQEALKEIDQENEKLRCWHGDHAGYMDTLKKSEADLTDKVEYWKEKYDDVLKRAINEVEEEAHNNLRETVNNFLAELGVGDRI